MGKNRTANIASRTSTKPVLALLAAAGLFFFCGATVWEGTAGVASVDSSGREVYSITTNAFPVNTVVDVTNLGNNKTVRVLVTGGLDGQGFLATLSGRAALSIGISGSSTVRIRITGPSDPQPYSEISRGPLPSDDEDTDTMIADLPEITEQQETSPDLSQWAEHSRPPAPQETTEVQESGDQDLSQWAEYSKPPGTGGQPTTSPDTVNPPATSQPANPPETAKPTDPPSATPTPVVPPEQPRETDQPSRPGQTFEPEQTQEPEQVPDTEWWLQPTPEQPQPPEQTPETEAPTPGQTSGLEQTPDIEQIPWWEQQAPEQASEPEQIQGTGQVPDTETPWWEQQAPERSQTPETGTPTPGQTSVPEQTQGTEQVPDTETPWWLQQAPEQPPPEQTLETGTPAPGQASEPEQAQGTGQAPDTETPWWLQPPPEQTPETGTPVPGQTSEPEQAQGTGQVPDTETPWWLQQPPEQQQPEQTQTHPEQTTEPGQTQPSESIGTGTQGSEATDTPPPYVIPAEQETREQASGNAGSETRPTGQTPETMPAWGQQSTEQGTAATAPETLQEPNAGTWSAGGWAPTGTQTPWEEPYAEVPPQLPPSSVPETQTESGKGTGEEAPFTLVPTEERIPPAREPGIASEYIIPTLESDRSTNSGNTGTQRPDISDDMIISPSMPSSTVEQTGTEEMQEGWYVQLGAFGQERNLLNEIARIEARHPDYAPLLVRRKTAGSLTRLLIGPLNQGESAAALRKIKSFGNTEAIVVRIR